jgi:hypothetical protein
VAQRSRDQGPLGGAQAHGGRRRAGGGDGVHTPPWLQSLSWAPTRPINFVQAGRMLSVAMSDAFTAQLEQLARRHLTLEDERLFGSFDAATKDRDIGRLLL